MEHALQKQTKNNSIQVLRILAMLWIIAFHFFDHGTIEIDTAKFGIGWLLLAAFYPGGAVGNCIFVLITGYLLCDKEYKLSRLVVLYLEVWFYSVLTGTLAYLLGFVDLTAGSLKEMLLPVAYNQYWYMSSYMVLYLFIPVLNKSIASFSKKQFAFVILAGLLFLSVIPTFLKATWMWGGNDLMIFVPLYFIGAYLRKFGVQWKTKKLYLLTAAIGLAILACELVMKKWWLGVPFHYFVWKMAKTPILLFSVALFAAFIKTEIYAPKWILWISESMFGVYLWHIGRLRPLFFKVLFDNAQTYNSLWIVAQGALAVVFIFLTGVVVDKIRLYCLERPIVRLLQKPLKKLDAFSTELFPNIYIYIYITDKQPRRSIRSAWVSICL